MTKTLESIHADGDRIDAYYSDGSAIRLGYLTPTGTVLAFVPSIHPTPLLSADHLRDLADIVDEANAR